MATGQGMRIADEQATLRQVTTLVARGAPQDVLTALRAEVGRLLGVRHLNLVRYDPDCAATTVGAWASHGATVPSPSEPCCGWVGAT